MPFRSRLNLDDRTASSPILIFKFRHRAYENRRRSVIPGLQKDLRLCFFRFLECLCLNRRRGTHWDFIIFWRYQLVRVVHRSSRTAFRLFLRSFLPLTGFLLRPSDELVAHACSYFPFWAFIRSFTCSIPQ